VPLAGVHTYPEPVPTQVRGSGGPRPRPPPCLHANGCARPSVPFWAVNLELPTLGGGADAGVEGRSRAGWWGSGEARGWPKTRLIAEFCSPGGRARVTYLEGQCLATRPGDSVPTRWPRQSCARLVPLIELEDPGHGFQPPRVHQACTGKSRAEPERQRHPLLPLVGLPNADVPSWRGRSPEEIRA